MTATAIESNKMTARAYAVSLGLAKDGRGRMSPAAHAAIEKAKAEGVVFLPSASEIAKAEAQRRQDEGRTRRKPRAAAGSVSPRLVDGKASNKPAKLGEDGLPVHPSMDWYQRVFAFGNFVVNPEGMTLRVISEAPDGEGFTHFIDKVGKFWKAKVNASWGTRAGWPTGVESSDND